MNGFSRTFWAAVAAFCQWRAEREYRSAKDANESSFWCAERARECERRARGEAEVRR